MALFTPFIVVATSQMVLTQAPFKSQARSSHDRLIPDKLKRMPCIINGWGKTPSIYF